MAPRLAVQGFEVARPEVCHLPSSPNFFNALPARLDGAAMSSRRGIRHLTHHKRAEAPPPCSRGSPAAAGRSAHVYRGDEPVVLAGRRTRTRVNLFLFYRRTKVGRFA